jgi:DNA replication and repair protein RecF
MERLRVEGLRNIRDVELGLGGRCALIVGANGAGKTTLLEAVYLLARGRSFRGRRAGNGTTDGFIRTRVEAEFSLGRDSVIWVFERSGRGTGRWIDGMPLGEAGDLGKRFSVRLVGENAQQLLEGDPALRRRFMDLNLFHVEPGYGSAWKRFRQVLEQRNAWLRQGGRGRKVWDEEFLAAGQQLDTLRERGVCGINWEFRRLASVFDGLEDVAVTYVKGVPGEKSLRDALKVDGVGERLLGYTRVGPHRADLLIGNGSRGRSLSRGQQKAAVCLLQLACAAVQEAAQGVPSLWLLDDIWSELDWEGASKLVGMVLDGDRQCLFTMIECIGRVLPSFLPSDTRLFHVEQGRVVV